MNKLTCSSCGLSLNNDCFFKDGSRKRGYEYRCKLCRYKYNKQKNIIKGRNSVREKVRIRDDYTCQSCGIKLTTEQVQKQNQKYKSLKGRIKSLDVHHLNGLCGKKSKKYDRMVDIDNLITLCRKCHFNHHQHVFKTRG